MKKIRKRKCFLRNAGSIFLDREVVKNGSSIYIFPEGTRNKGNTSLSSFKEGARVIALKNRLPILPVYIKTNANKVLKEAINKRDEELTIDIEVGDLIDYKDKTSLEENYRKIFNL